MKGMKAGGMTKMGAVKTAAPSRDGVASKGKTKGKSMESLKHSFASGAPRSTAVPPLGRGTNPPSSTAEQGGLTWRQMLDGTRKNDASALREAIKNGLH